MKNKIPGDIIAIPLSGKKYAFAMVLKDPGISVYDYIGNDQNDKPKTAKYLFTVWASFKSLEKNNVRVIGHEEVTSPEDIALPPMWRRDLISGAYEIYKDGKFIPSDRFECEPLEVAAVWDYEHIVDRVNGDDKWQKSLIDFQTRVI